MCSLVFHLLTYSYCDRDQWFRSWLSECIGVVTYEVMTPQCGRSVIRVLVVRVDIRVVTYEAMTPQCERSVVQVLVAKWI